MSNKLYRATNLTIDNTFTKNPNRYYLENFFVNKPIEKANPAGAGISSFVTSKVYNDGMDIVTILNIDLNGCNDSGVNSSVIGESGSTSPGQITQFTTAKNGYIHSIVITCCELPVDGDTDININVDSGIINVGSTLSDSTEIFHFSGHDSWTLGQAIFLQSTNGDSPFNGILQNKYLYLNCHNGATGTDYSAGQYIILIRGRNPSNSIIPLETNMSFEINGTNCNSISHSSTIAGIELTTAGADNDQSIIRPTNDSNGSAWAATNWGTENKILFVTCITTSNNISNMTFWCGLKLTSTGAYATDADQAYFLYSTNGDLGTLTTNANLHFVYSIDGTDYITDLGIAVAVSTKYILKINIDSNREIRIYVNETLYGLATTSVAGGTTQSTTTKKSNALTNNIDLIPYTGIQSLSADVKTITLSYIKLSKEI